MRTSWGATGAKHTVILRHLHACRITMLTDRIGGCGSRMDCDLTYVIFRQED